MFDRPFAPARRRTASILLRLVVALGCGTAPASAQIDVQPLTRDEAPEGVSGSLTGNLAAQAGNSDFVQLGVNARVFKVRGDVTSMIVGNGGLGFVGRSRFSSSGLFHYRRYVRR